MTCFILYFFMGQFAEYAWQVHAREISRKLKENGAKNGSARARSRRVLPYSANWFMGNYMKITLYNVVLNGKGVGT